MTVDIPASDARHERVSLMVDGVKIELAVVKRLSNLNMTPILFLHGWGSSKEDYTDIRLLPEFRTRPFIAYDAPGCGETWCEDLSKVNIPFLIKTAEALLAHYEISTFHLVGHSMGGLTGLQLAHVNPAAVRSFVNIKGNLGPEDCFISRQVIGKPQEAIADFLDGFILGCQQSSFYSAAVYGASIRQKVQIGAIKGILESMVELSDTTDLLATFLSLPFPKVFMYGEQYAGLSYLPRLKAAEADLAEIPRAGHFPMYSNPHAMWSAIDRFVSDAE